MLQAHPDLARPLRYSSEEFSSAQLFDPRVLFSSYSLQRTLLTAGSLTCSDKLRDVPVAGDLPRGDLLDGSVDRVEEDFGFVGTSHLSSSLGSRREPHV